MDEQLARSLANNPEGLAPTAAGGGGNQREGRGTPTDLPDDFLRVNNQTGSNSDNVGSTPQEQILSDEALARMLQDEMFSQELARNPEFAHITGGGSNPGLLGAPSLPAAARATS